MSETTRKILLSLRARTMMECSRLVQIPAGLSPNDIEDVARKLNDRIDGTEFKEDPEYWERSDPNWDTVDWKDPPEFHVVRDDDGALLILTPLQYWRRSLKVGQPVFWDDPDRHLSSGEYVVAGINADGDITDDTIVAVKNAAGSWAEVLPAELFPERPAELLDVVLNGEVIGLANSAACAADLACQGYPDDDGYWASVQENVAAAGIRLAKAWVVRKGPPQPDEALLMHLDTSLRLVLDVKYHCNGVSNLVLREKLESVVQQAVAEGMLTGDTAAEVVSIDRVVVPYAGVLSEETLAHFMLRRIEDGDLDLADIPVRLARYGLMDPIVFNQEMRERIEMGMPELLPQETSVPGSSTAITTSQPGAEFDEFQQVILAAYNDGDHCVHAPADIHECGDTLLTFLLVELSRNEDCDSMDCAVDRLDSAIRQLTALRGVFEAKSLE